MEKVMGSLWRACAGATMELPEPVDAAANKGPGRDKTLPAPIKTGASALSIAPMLSVAPVTPARG
jgi:hypothetical protein